MKKSVFLKSSLILMCFVLLLSAVVACDNSGENDIETTAEATVGTSAQTTAQTSAQTSEETTAGTSAETSAETTTDNVSKNEWDAMTAASKFDNVTFTNNATFVSGYDSQSSHVNVFKMDGDRGTADGVPMDASSMEAARAMITGTAVAIVKDFDKFTYDAVGGYYSSIDDIVYNVSIMGINATITAKNVVVKLDSDMNIASISCNMTQQFSEGGAHRTYVLNVIFTFADYGTTVLSGSDANEMQMTITEEEWITACSFDYSAYQCKITCTMSGGVTYYMEQTVEGNKLQMVDKSSAGKMAIDYMEKVDGGWYYYNDETESDDANAVRTYTKRLVTLEDTKGEDEFEDTKNGPKRMLSSFVGAYDSFKYDAERGCCVADAVDGGISNVTVFMLNGKISYLSYTAGPVTYEFEMNYDDIALTLPSV